MWETHTESISTCYQGGPEKFAWDDDGDFKDGQISNLKRETYNVITLVCSMLPVGRTTCSVEKTHLGSRGTTTFTPQDF